MTPSRPARFGAASAGVPFAAVAFAAVSFAAFAGVGLALLSQHVWGMEPCAWCVLQRLIFLAVGVVALVGVAWRGVTAARVVGGVALLLALAGLASAVWQHFVAARSASCAMTLADRIVTGMGLDALLPDVFSARASCAEAAVDLLGVPYAYWSAALFVALIVGLLLIVRRA